MGLMGFRFAAVVVGVGLANAALAAEDAGSQGGAPAAGIKGGTNPMEKAPDKGGDKDRANVAELRKPQYWFGVAVENIPPPIARQLKLGRDQGLMVMAVLRDSPAARAGLKADDLLIEVEGEALTSQEQLARSANSTEEPAGVGGGDGGAVNPRPRKTHLTLLREGDRVTVEITPALRPVNMMVAGGAVGSFTLSPRQGDEKVPGVRNIVLSNGGAAQVGPGYRIDLSGKGPTGLSDISIKQIVAKGQTLILSQEQDGSGGVRMSITVGGQRYPVEAGKIDSLPAELRPIAEQLLADGSGARGAAPHPPDESLDRRVKELELRNEELNKQLAELIKLLREKSNK